MKLTYGNYTISLGAWPSVKIEHDGANMGLSRIHIEGKRNIRLVRDFLTACLEDTK